MSVSTTNSSESRLTRQLSIFSKVKPHCDPALAAGIASLQDWLTKNQSASLDSKRYSLTAALSRFVDDPYRQFARKVRLPDRAYSHWVKNDRSALVSYFSRFAEHASRLADPDEADLVRCGEAIVDEEHPDFFPTLDALIELTFLCCSADGTEGRAVLVDDACATLELVKDKGARRKSFTSPWPSYRYFHSDGMLCEFCGDVTAQARHIIGLREKRYTARPSAEKVLSVLCSGGRILTPGHGAKFCAAHDPTLEPAAYRKAWRRSEYAHAARRFIILVRQAFNVGPQGLLDRALAFSFANRFRGLSLLDEMVQVVDAHFRRAEGSDARSKSRDEFQPIVQMHKKLLEALRIRDDPHYRMFQSLSDESGLEIAIRDSIELQAIPEIVAFNYDLVYCPIARIRASIARVPLAAPYILPDEFERTAVFQDFGEP